MAVPKSTTAIRAGDSAKESSSSKLFHDLEKTLGSQRGGSSFFSPEEGECHVENGQHSEFGEFGQIED